MWVKYELATVETIYQQHLREQQIMLHDGKLIILKLIFQHVRFISLIIVPTSFRIQIFSHYHAGPTGGHMGEYETLFYIRLQFFWTGLQKDFKEWVKGCSHCVSHNAGRSRKSNMYLSWPVTMQFYIMCVDIWSPSRLVETKKYNIQLMNSIFDLTQFLFHQSFGI